MAIARRGEAPAWIVKDFDISESCLCNWMHAADVEGEQTSGRERERVGRAARPAPANRLLEQENEIVRPGRGPPIAGQPAAKMMHPLIRDLAADGIPSR